MNFLLRFPAKIKFRNIEEVNSLPQKIGKRLEGVQNRMKFMEINKDYKRKENRCNIKTKGSNDTLTEIVQTSLKAFDLSLNDLYLES